MEKTANRWESNTHTHTHTQVLLENKEKNNLIDKIKDSDKSKKCLICRCLFYV